MSILETDRLTLRNADHDDAPFVLRLLNEPSFIRFIGDRGVRTVDAARDYIETRFIDSYTRHGFGLWIVELKDSPGAMGISGLVKRDALPNPDIGFAFLPEFWNRGYALESARAVKQWALDTLRLPRLSAITDADNTRSIAIVEKLGLTFEREMQLPSAEKAIRLYTLTAPHGAASDRSA